jgi:hypothetical protein
MPTSNDLTDLESQVKRSKISATSFKRQGLFGSSDQIISIHKTIGNLAGHVRKTVIRINTLEKLVDNQSRKITSLKNISGIQGQRIGGTNIGAKLPGGSVDNLNKTISTIELTVSSIAETLKAQKKTSDATTENERKKAEREKRGLAESKLEKVFGGIAKTAQALIAPVKSIIDRILDFIKTVILGRIIYKLVGWFGDPKNADKVKSIIRFVKDWWPALLSAYIIFGTSFGRFTTKIIGMVARFAIQIATKAIPGLITLARRNPATAALAIGTTTYLTNQALNPSTQGNQEKQGFSGGGYARPRGFRGGGLASLRRFFGFDNGGYPGYVSGQKGVDKIPAMLSDGEFVMSRGAVQMYGADTLAAMNAAGGGTNRPKIMGGTAYAQGGGPMGRMPNPDPNYKDPVLDDRLNLMKSLEKYARSQVSAGGDGNLIKALNDVALSLKGQGASSSSGSGFRLPGLPSGGGFMSAGKQVLNSLQSNFNTIRDVARNASDSVSKLGTGKKYKMMAENNERKSQEAISKYDAWIQSLPKGFLKDTMNRGLIPIPTGNSFGMTGLTYVKAMMGPLGRPFKILSNESVDKARQEMIDRTAAANGLKVGADGKMSMEWNRVSGQGSGQYTDDLKSLGGASGFGGGKFFNSTFGRWSGTQKGDKIVTNDVYNFNEPVGVYAKKSMDAIKKGDIGQGFYNILSMAGKFAQDIGWMNQRALGSEIEVGSVKNIDPKTGKPKALPSSVTMYGPNDPRRKQTGPYKSRFAKPKPKTLPVKPPTRTTTVMQGQTAVTMYSKNDPRRKSNGTSTPRFSARPSSSSKHKILGITLPF